MDLYDTDMTKIGPATAEQIEAADAADGGWIWLGPDGEPAPVTDYDDTTVTINYGNGGGRGDMGETRPRQGYQQVCVA